MEVTDTTATFLALAGEANLQKAHPEKVVEIRDILKGFYNLEDITLDKKYSALCGYTQTDLHTVFREYFKDYDENEVREWYNGYSWTGKKVYNPFDVLLLFNKQEYKSWWFETGAPGFLIKLWKKSPRDPAKLSGLQLTEDLIGSFDIENLKPETLLFQSGYLTVSSYISNPEIGTVYTVDYPNREIRQSLNRLLLSDVIAPSESSLRIGRLELYHIMEANNLVGLGNYLKSFLASIPHNWYQKNPISDYEGYYSSLIYAFFAGLGYDIIPEDTTNHGQVDMTIRHSKFI